MNEISESEIQGKRRIEKTERGQDLEEKKMGEPRDQHEKSERWVSSSLSPCPCFLFLKVGVSRESTATGSDGREKEKLAASGSMVADRESGLQVGGDVGIQWWNWSSHQI
ncbi:unnamed protein product [Linum trigynum]|uniref:Uncharacterized protein n=1 Tax=Linum trigynum TaxID=586398 RepID=A0AAV2DY92_9ROSI